ncbi:hypothetical protein Y032_0156g3147 [Ancylostoma ceylanicum]|nr:hypothetical protein Y032_0156g3147 [Ancylostoma ceylanicum]
MIRLDQEKVESLSAFYPFTFSNISCHQWLNFQNFVCGMLSVFETVKYGEEVTTRKRLPTHNLITSLQVLGLALGEPRKCRLHPLLLKIIGTSVPESREAGKCETRRRRVGALVR